MEPSDPAPTLEASPDCPLLFDAADRGAALRSEFEDWLSLQAALFLDPTAATRRLARSRDVTRAVAGLARLSRAQLDERVSLLAELGVRALPVLSAAYPSRLRALADPSPLLLVRGDPRILTGRGVAIVGSRAASGYGLDVAAQLAGRFAEAGLAVISGLARGVDAAAHQAALDAGGPTVAFSACGPDRVYPPEHAALARAIADQGALVTEMPPGTPPRAPLTGAARARRLRRRWNEPI